MTYNTQYSATIAEEYKELSFLLDLAKKNERTIEGAIHRISKGQQKQYNSLLEEHDNILDYAKFVLTNGMTGKAGEPRAISEDKDLIMKLEAIGEMTNLLKEYGVNIEKARNPSVSQSSSTGSNISNHTRQSNDSGYQSESQKQEPLNKAADRYMRDAAANNKLGKKADQKNAIDDMKEYKSKDSLDPKDIMMNPQGRTMLGHIQGKEPDNRKENQRIERIVKAHYTEPQSSGLNETKDQRKKNSGYNDKLDQITQMFNKENPLASLNNGYSNHDGYSNHEIKGPTQGRGGHNNKSGGPVGGDNNR